MPWDHVYHVAFVVPDLDVAIAGVGQQLGLSFAKPRTRSFELRNAEGTSLAAEDSSDVYYVYSRGAPPYVELIEAKSAGVWAADSGARIHHVGTWSDDIRSDARRLEERGFRIEAFGGVAGDGERFAYLTNDFGLRLELVDASLREGLETRLRVAPV